MTILFKTIEIKAKVRNQNIHIYRPNPQGYTYEEYCLYDQHAVKAFGNKGPQRLEPHYDHQQKEAIRSISDYRYDRSQGTC